MSVDISDLLNQFLSIYQREPDALMRALADPQWVFTADIPLHEQAKILTTAENRVRQSLVNRTLITASGAKQRQVHLQKELGDSREVFSEMTGEELVDWLNHIQKEKAKNAELVGLSVKQYEIERAKHDLDAQDSEAEILRYFAERLSSMVSAFELLDSENYIDFVPEQLKNVFKELHINFALGHKSTTCILCGAILEQSLKERLKLEGDFGEILESAKELLDQKELTLAKQIYRTRNGAIHGNVDFRSVKFERVIFYVQETRKIVAKLYKT